MRFEIESKYNVQDKVFISQRGQNGIVVNVRFNLPVPNTYHIHYLVEFEDGTRLWFVEDRVNEVRDSI